MAKARRAAKAINVSTKTKLYKMYGVPEMKKTLQAYMDGLDPENQKYLRQEIKTVLMPAANMLRDAAINLAPKKSGNLSNSIFSTPGGERMPGVLVAVNHKNAPYGGLVERGTSRMAAQPFFRPAIKAVRGTMAFTISEGLKRLLEGIGDKAKYTLPAMK